MRFRHVSLIVATGFLAPAFAETTADRWNLSEIYPSVAAWNADADKVDTQLNALDSDRDLLQTKLDLRQIRLNELLSVVQLYRALGGGWQS